MRTQSVKKREPYMGSVKKKRIKCELGFKAEIEKALNGSKAILSLPTIFAKNLGTLALLFRLFD